MDGLAYLVEEAPWLLAVIILVVIAGVVLGVVLYVLRASREQERREDIQPTYRRRPIPDDVKMFVWRRDGGCCVTCGSQEKLEFDHIIPLSKGGSDTARNLQLLCESCNRSKGGNLV